MPIISDFFFVLLNGLRIYSNIERDHMNIPSDGISDMVFGEDRMLE